MLKRTIVISNQAFLKKENDQILIKQGDEERSVPIEDVAVLLLESPQITVTQPVLMALAANDAAVIVCDGSHLPNGLMLPFTGNAIHTAILASQLEASVPFRKKLWRQTVKAKLVNQASILQSLGMNTEPLLRWATQVKSDDKSNLEGRGAKFYWEHFLPPEFGFQRDPEGSIPNNLLNYGYAILRASVARALVSSGLHPALGIHHRNQYNPFCLADDVMEPYRPFVDMLIRKIVITGEDVQTLTPDLKKRILGILTADVDLDGERKPLLVALSSTTFSLAQCYEKEERVLRYPRIPV